MCRPPTQQERLCLSAERRGVTRRDSKPRCFRLVAPLLGPCHTNTKQVSQENRDYTRTSPLLLLQAIHSTIQIPPGGLLHLDQSPTATKKGFTALKYIITQSHRETTVRYAKQGLRETSSSQSHGALHLSTHPKTSNPGCLHPLSCPASNPRNQALGVRQSCCGLDEREPS